MHVAVNHVFSMCNIFQVFNCVVPFVQIFMTHKPLLVAHRWPQKRKNNKVMDISTLES